jgi:hypothetical protein
MGTSSTILSPLTSHLSPPLTFSSSSSGERMSELVDRLTDLQRRVAELRDFL